MVATPRAATIADLHAMPDDGQRHELIDGEIIVTASPSWVHQQAVGNLHLLLRAWVDPRSLGQVALSPIDIVLSETTVVQPDLLFVSNANLSKLSQGRYRGTPDLAVEVISPSNQNYDAVTKMFRYAQAGIPEYWLVDPIARTFVILSLGAGNIYVPREPDTAGQLASVVLPGLTIEPAALFSAPNLST